VSTLGNGVKQDRRFAVIGLDAGLKRVQKTRSSQILSVQLDPSSREEEILVKLILQPGLFQTIQICNQKIVRRMATDL
jgi:hypothetical protein